MTPNTPENITQARAGVNKDIKRASFKTSGHLEDIGSTSPDHDIPDERIWDSDSPHNSRNWPPWKKNAQILMISFHYMMGTFMSVGIIPAYDTFVEEYNVTMPTASYLTSIHVFAVKYISVAIAIVHLFIRKKASSKSCFSAYPP